jgi:hypothetical protein
VSEKPELVSPFRIAFREEGMFVNVYLAKQGTMDDAMLIGSVARSILNADAPAQFNRFKEVFQVGIAACIKDVMGIDVQKFETSPAPEAERAGNA